MSIVKNFPNYFISRDGIVTNIKTKRVLKLSKNKVNGYTMLTLSEKGKSHPTTLHRLLAEHFIYNSNPDKLRVVDHINGDRLDNDLTNLRWTTPSGNGLNRKAKNVYNNIINGNEYIVARFTCSKCKLYPLSKYDETEARAQASEWIQNKKQSYIDNIV